jgi:hypothetical protein
MGKNKKACNSWIGRIKSIKLQKYLIFGKWESYPFMEKLTLIVHFSCQKFGTHLW